MTSGTSIPSSCHRGPHGQTLLGVNSVHFVNPILDRSFHYLQEKSMHTPLQEKCNTRFFQYPIHMPAKLKVIHVAQVPIYMCRKFDGQPKSLVWSSAGVNECMCTSWTANNF